MKKILIFLTLFSGFAMTAQQVSQEQQLQQTVETFFEGFHARDSIKIKSVMFDQVTMQSVMKNREGKQILHTEEFSNFLKSIVSIPAEMTFKEEIHDYKIRIDGSMANVWTPYSFYLNKNLSHVGVNSFQLYKKDGNWKIIYLIDTRRRETK